MSEQTGSERRVFAQHIVADTKEVPPTQQEKLAAALWLLADALEIPPGTAAKFSRQPFRANAKEQIFMGIAMVIDGLPALSEADQVELTAFAMRALKRLCPVEVSWNLYDDTRQWTGTVKSLVSQHFAEKNFGLPPWRS